VGGRLLAFRNAWEILPLTTWHTRLLSSGLHWHWVQAPPVTDQPQFIVLPLDPIRRGILLTEIKALVDKRALVPADPSPGFYSHLFVVPKNNGGFRPVIDLKRLNQYIVCPSFRMETPQSIRRQLRVGEFTTSVDLADAYLHIPVAPAFQRFLRIAVQGQVWQFRAMPFGLNIAPRTFTNLLSPVASFLRARGIRIHRYLDDWLIRAESVQESLHHTDQVLQLFDSLGLLVRREKSDLVPRMAFVFLGVHFDLATGLVAPPSAKILGVVQLVHSILPQSRIRLRLLLRLIGILNHVADYVRLGRLHLRPIQFYLLTLQVDLRHDLETLVPIRPGLRLALLPWTDQQWLGASVPLRPPTPTLTLATDASRVGWGGHMGHHLPSGRWSLEESQLHISLLELRAVRYALRALAPQVQGRSIRIMMDNVVAAAYIRREGGTRSMTLYTEARCLLLWCQDHRVHLTPHFLPGRLNVLADYQSRPDQVLATEWTLDTAVFRRLQTHFPLMAIDLFATRLNHRLPMFVSPFPDPLAVDSDALTMEWDGLQAYAFPPFAIIPEVLFKVGRSDMSCVLISPWWPTQPWFPEVLRLLMGPPVQLPHYRRLLSQPLRQVYHQRPEWLSLHAWPLSGSVSVRRAFQSELRRLRLATSGPVPSDCTSRTGGPSGSGAGSMDWMPSIPL